ncbi:MAG: SufS family cysteine desulfurase [Bacteroidales bacterium]|nr:SufS family cysteine desulfurase [Bacteroidales bacterium]
MENLAFTIRNHFPGLQNTVYGRPLVYLDNAATSQRPAEVLALQKQLGECENANIHRAVHKLSQDATDRYEAGRSAVMRFLNVDPAVGCVVFTSGATAAFNLLATCFSARYLKAGDQILISEAEHHSNLVPWQMACVRTGAELVVVPVDADGTLSLREVEKRLSGRVKLVSIAQISNVLGVVNPVREIIAAAHAKGIPVAIDGAQGVVHAACDVQALDCDFYIFSGHKIYAPTGTGVLYGKRRFLDEMPPYMGGGDMVDTVSFEHTTYNELPLKYEAGTPNFTGQACFAPALELADTLRNNADVKAMERAIVAYLAEELPRIEGLKIFGLPADLATKIPLFSLTVEGTHPSDLAQILDKLGIAVRSGWMCAEPLVRRFSDRGMLRASFLPYNTMEEAESFVAGLKRAIKMLK